VAADHPDIVKRIESIAASARTQERRYDEGQRKTAVDFVR